MYEKRFYRAWSNSVDLVSFNVIEKESDLFVMAEKNLEEIARRLLSKYRSKIEDYINKRPLFKTALSPIEPLGKEEDIIKNMIEASMLAGVGPMATVAGTVSDFIGKDLLEYSGNVIVENGGDIFVKSSKERLFAIFAGESFFSRKIAIKIKPEKTPLGVCTSSATVGSSLSFGNTDATVIISKNASIADAFATAVGNMVKNKSDVEKTLNFIKTKKEILGAVIVIKDKIAICGDIEIVKI